jgi:hypothetical protein
MLELLSTILSCSLYLADDDLVRAIAESNSQSNPYFVLDTTIDLTQVDPPPPPKSSTEAVERTHGILAKGGRPVLGLLQLPPSWLSAFGRDLPSAFDACANIAIGTAMLSQFDAECAHAPKASQAKVRPAPTAARAGRRHCVLGKYAEAIGAADFVTITLLELRYQRPRRPDVADAPIFAVASSRNWGADQLLLPIR